MSDQTTLEGDSAEIVSLPRAGVRVTESQLREWYLEQRRSTEDIAEKLGTSQTSVIRLMNQAGIDRRSGPEASKEYLEEIRSREYADPEVLRELHHEEGLTLTAIADKFGLTNTGVAYWFKKHNIEVNTDKYEIPEWTMCVDESGGGHEGYPVWKGCDGDVVAVHRLAVIADGADPHKVFSGDYSVDHLNRHPCDNRPENLELLSFSEHGRREARRNIEYASGFTEEDLKFAIRFMLNPSVYLER